MPNYKRKRDANERAIIDALQAVGCAVIQENNVDLYVMYQGKWHPMEVKTRYGSRTRYQESLHAQLAEYGYEIPIVKTVEEALDIIGIRQS